MTFLQQIGEFFTNLFNETAKAYNHLEGNEQTAIKTASGWLAIVGSNLTASPDVVFSLIQAAYPSITKDVLTGYLHQLGGQLGIIAADTPPDFTSAMTALQTYLGKHTGNAWIAIIKAVVALLATIIEPGTIIQKIEMVLEYVYQNYIRGKIQTTAAAA